MLTVQKTEPAKQPDKKPPTREFPRTEKKNKGFLDVLIKVATDFEDCPEKQGRGAALRGDGLA